MLHSDRENSWGRLQTWFWGQGQGGPGLTSGYLTVLFDSLKGWSGALWVGWDPQCLYTATCFLVAGFG